MIYAQTSKLNKFEVDSQGTLINGLVSYWKLDETSGTRFDSFGTNHLTSNNNIISLIGKKGNATNFAAKTDRLEQQYLHVQSFSLDFGDQDFTIAGWVYIGGGSKSNSMAILSKADSSTSRQFLLEYNKNVDRFRFNVNAGSGWIGVNADNLGSPSVADVWYYIVAWHDSVNNQIGIQVNNENSNTASHSTGMITTPSKLIVGTFIDVPGYAWNGAIDELGFWKRVLTSQEKSDLYNNRKGNTVTRQKYIISGRVFIDYNGNGIIDGNDKGIPLETVYLQSPDGAVTHSTIQPNHIDGGYAFGGLDLGTYRITYKIPSGYRATTETSVVRSITNSDVVQHFGVQQIITDQCAGIVCNMPPSSYCNGNYAITYSSNGTCSAGTCTYSTTSTYCPNVCKDGTCIDTQAPALITSCGEIKRSGNYVLGSNLASSGDTCLNIHDVNDVHVDCRGYSIKSHSLSIPDFVKGSVSAVKFTNVRNFSLSSCMLTGTGTYTIPLHIAKSIRGVIKNNIIGNNNVRVDSSSYLHLIENTFKADYYQIYSSYITIEKNVFNPVEPINTSGMISSLYGTNNKIINNDIDGKSDGIFNSELYKNIGADDGIIIQDESNDLIQDNRIKNNWDCGIETAGLVTDTQFVKNTITNSGVCGVGGWYWNSWKGNKVIGNIVDYTPQLFAIYRSYGLRPGGSDTPKDTYVYFQDNVFDNNKFINPRIAPAYSANFNFRDFGALSALPGELPVTPDKVIIGNNKFMNNDFSTLLLPPYFIPQSMIVDGGGNICSLSSEPTYPLKCGKAITPSIQVVSPNGGEVWRLGSRQTLRWNIPLSMIIDKNYGYILSLVEGVEGPTQGVIYAQKFNKNFPPSSEIEWIVNSVSTPNGELPISPGTYKVMITVYDLYDNCPLCRSGTSDIGDTKLYPIIAQDFSDSPFTISPEEFPSYTFALKLYKGWNLFSAPVGSVPISSDFQKNIDIDFVQYKSDCKYKSSLWVFSNSLKRYEKSFGFYPYGQAYWIKVENDCIVNVEGNGKISSDSLFSNGLKLYKGWNIIGGLDETVHIDKVRNNCDIVKGLYYYNPKGNIYEQSVFMDSGRGYIIGVRNDCTLKFAEESDSDAPPTIPDIDFTSNAVRIR